MPLASVRDVFSTLALLVGLWVLFLIAAHLILDIEQGNKHIKTLSLTYFGNASDDSTEEKLYFDDGQGVDDPNIMECEIPHDKSFPNCKNRVELLQKNWRLNSCYKEYDVDGTTCSIVIYLSEVESWCPQFPWRKYLRKKERRRKKAVFRESPDRLLSMLKAIPRSQSIRSRISNMWPYWRDGVHYMQKKQGNGDTRGKRKIMIFIGELTEASADISGLTDNLLQWSDLLASLYILGHDVTIHSDRVELLSFLTDGSQFMYHGCDKGESDIDLIYIDITGLQILMISAPDPRTRSLIWSKFSCRLRVVSPFGMDAEFNYRDYSGPLMGERSRQGNWNLNLKQFLTRYPLSVDNSFLGFSLKSIRNESTPQKTSMAFVYGKPPEFKAHKHFLKAIYKHMRLHTAMFTGGEKAALPFMVNHGNLNLTSIRRLLRKSKLFIGLGFPYEGHLVLEAIAQGCIFINPKFSPRKNRLNTEILKEYPSARNLSSQHPYAEIFIGKPMVYTMNIWNKTETARALREILKQQAKLILPFEFTCEGMLERLNAYIENQDFCDKSYHWPLNNDDLRISISRAGESCTDKCFREGLTCEPEYFFVLNSSKISKCAQVVYEKSNVAPAREVVTSKCVLQQEPLLFSCAAHNSSYRRFCPCRSYRKQQISLCGSCF